MGIFLMCYSVTLLVFIPTQFKRWYDDRVDKWLEQFDLKAKVILELDTIKEDKVLEIQRLEKEIRIKKETRDTIRKHLKDRRPSLFN